MGQSAEQVKTRLVSSHIVLSAAMWASADLAKKQQYDYHSLLYFDYAISHMALSFMSTIHDIGADDINRMKYRDTVHWLLKGIPDKHLQEYSTVRTIIDRLNITSPNLETALERGFISGCHNVQEIPCHCRISAIEQVESISLHLFNSLLQKIECYCQLHQQTPLLLGRKYFIDHYLDEELLLEVIPNQRGSLRAMQCAIALIAG